MDNKTNSATDREALATDTFVQLVDSLVDDFDVIDMLTLLAHRATDLLGAKAAGILLADDRGKLRLVAASDENVELLELFQLQNDEGPCLDGFRTGTVVTESDLRTETPWPVFSPEAVRHGFNAVCAVPLRLRSDVMGCLNIFMSEAGEVTARNIALARGLAGVATIAMMQDRALRDSQLQREQLQGALDSRVVIEQAKGMIAERAGVDFAEAFDVLRQYSRSRNLRLTDVSERLLRKDITVSDLTGQATVDLADSSAVERYVCRATDQPGQILGVVGSNRRNTAAAEQFFAKALRDHCEPLEIVTDRSPTLASVIADWTPDAGTAREGVENASVP